MQDFQHWPESLEIAVLLFHAFTPSVLPRPGLALFALPSYGTSHPPPGWRQLVKHQKTLGISGSCWDTKALGLAHAY